MGADARTEINSKVNNMILLLDNYQSESKKLHDSMKMSGYDCPTFAINDDGFLPPDVTSVYGFFLGDYSKEKFVKSKYFNEIPVPDYWEISGNNTSGEIHDLNRLRGKIFYANPLYKRIVKVVDWYDERETVRICDHYNRYGHLYAKTIFNAKGQKVNKSYFDAAGKEIIVENFVTGDIILNYEGKTRIFADITAFVMYFIKKSNLKQTRMFFNSLSIPFFVSQRLKAGNEKQDLLFWQEPVYDEIPGNMQMIFNGQAGRTAHIIVQKKESYDKLIKLGAPSEYVHRLGFVFPFVKENNFKPEALICTNSDNIEQCRKLVEGLPQIHFHIAAITEMSSKLHSMGAYTNVSLYPGVKNNILDELFKQCDYYFDINHGNEIVDAVYKAFLHNQLIFAFRETLHNAEYTADENIYQSSEVERMLSDIRQITSDRELLNRKIENQRDNALSEDTKAYDSVQLY